MTALLKRIKGTYKAGTESEVPIVEIDRTVVSELHSRFAEVFISPYLHPARFVERVVGQWKSYLNH